MSMILKLTSVFKQNPRNLLRQYYQKIDIFSVKYVFYDQGYSRNKCIGGSDGSAIKIWCPVGVKSV